MTNIITQAKAFFAGITDSTLFLLFGGFFGALIYARHQKLKLWEAIAAVILGTASSALLGPFIVQYFGFQDNHSAYAACGFMIGMLVKEVAELIFKLLDELQANPSLLIDFIKKRKK
jgi:uncharacterized membrane protein YfcA